MLPKPERLPLPLRHILELAVYALLFQERVPDHAAVHSAVAQAERLFGRSLARVTNGALRSIQRFGAAVDTREFYVVGKEGALADEWGGLCVITACRDGLGISGMTPTAARPRCA